MIKFFIHSGGARTRLWSVSREEPPKPLMKLASVYCRALQVQTALSDEGLTAEAALLIENSKKASKGPGLEPKIALDKFCQMMVKALLPRNPAGFSF